MKKGFITEILRSNKTVFSFKDLILLWNNIDTETAKKRVSHYVKHGDLYHVRRGLYAKDKNYDKFELSTKILTPSYISFETILAKAGIIFQYYSQIFVASYQSRDIICDNQAYSFKHIKDTILTNNAGVENKGNYFAAMPERAFLDVVYLYKNYYFDNLRPLDWKRVFEILPIYDNKQMTQRVNKYFKNFKIKEIQ